MINLHLDIDGVINADMPQGWGKTAEGRAGVITGSGGWSQSSGGFRIRWAPAMIKALSELPVELVWTTTWRDYAISEIAPLIDWGGHGDVMHPIGGELYWPSIDWKFEAMCWEYSDYSNRFIWIDDEIEGVHEEWAKRHAGLAIAPNPTTGITKRNIEAIKAFIEEDVND